SAGRLRVPMVTVGVESPAMGKYAGERSMTKSTGWRVAGLLAASALACSAAASEGTAHWNHDPAGQTGPGAWGTLSFPHATCGGGDPFVEVGMKQSPVDIETGRVVAAPLPAIEFGYRETAFVVENTGHDVKVPYQPGSSIAVGQAGYDLLQLHVHARSEHTVDGKHAAAEIHLVHQDRSLDLAVVGLQVEVGTPVNVVA